MLRTTKRKTANKVLFCLTIEFVQQQKNRKRATSLRMLLQWRSKRPDAQKLMPRKQGWQQRASAANAAGRPSNSVQSPTDVALVFLQTLYVRVRHTIAAFLPLMALT